MNRYFPCSRLKPSVVFTLAALAGLTAPAQAASFTEALTGGTPALDVRLRYENVDQDNGLDDADALTLRARLGYNSGVYMNTSGYIEMEHTSALVEDYNSGAVDTDKIWVWGEAKF